MKVCVSWGSSINAVKPSADASLVAVKVCEQKFCSLFDLGSFQFCALMSDVPTCHSSRVLKLGVRRFSFRYHFDCRSVFNFLLFWYYSFIYCIFVSILMRFTWNYHWLASNGLFCSFLLFLFRYRLSFWFLLRSVLCNNHFHSLIYFFPQKSFVEMPFWVNQFSLSEMLFAFTF